MGFFAAYTNNVKVGTREQTYGLLVTELLVHSLYRILTTSVPKCRINLPNGQIWNYVRKFAPGTNHLCNFCEIFCVGAFMFLIRSVSVNRPPTSAFTFGAFSYNLQQITMAKLLIGSEKVRGMQKWDGPPQVWWRSYVARRL